MKKPRLTLDDIHESVCAINELQSYCGCDERPFIKRRLAELIEDIEHDLLELPQPVTDDRGTVVGYYGPVPIHRQQSSPGSQPPGDNEPGEDG